MVAMRTMGIRLAAVDKAAKVMFCEARLPSGLPPERGFAAERPWGALALAICAMEGCIGDVLPPESKETVGNCGIVTPAIALAPEAAGAAVVAIAGGLAEGAAGA